MQPNSGSTKKIQWKIGWRQSKNITNKLINFYYHISVLAKHNQKARQKTAKYKKKNK
jgi:predicted amidophosphoribosyltransferase